MFVDADVEVHPDALRRLREAFEREPAASTPSSAPTTTGPPPRAVVSRFRNLLHHHVHAGAGGPATTFWAGLGAVRREAFDAVGGFDAQRYPRPCIEDIELGMRLHAAGRRIALDPAVRGTHLKRWTLRVDAAHRPRGARRAVGGAAPGARRRGRRRAEPRLGPAHRGGRRRRRRRRGAERPRPVGARRPGRDDRPQRALLRAARAPRRPAPGAGRRAAAPPPPPDRGASVPAGVVLWARGRRA